MASDLFRQTLEEMVDPKHPLVILSRRIPWKTLEEKVAPLLVPERRSASAVEVDDLFGSSVQMVSPNPGGRPRLPTRLLMSLLYLKHAFNLSDEELCARWAESVPWAHIIRNLECMAGFKGDPGDLGRWLVHFARIIIQLEHRWRKSGYQSEHYRRRLIAARENFKHSLEQGHAQHDGKKPGACARNCSRRSRCSGVLWRRPVLT